MGISSKEFYDKLCTMVDECDDISTCLFTAIHEGHSSHIVRGETVDLLACITEMLIHIARSFEGEDLVTAYCSLCSQVMGVGVAFLAKEENQVNDEDKALATDAMKEMLKKMIEGEDGDGASS